MGKSWWETSPQQETKKSVKIWTIILIAVFVIAVVFAGIYYFAFQSLQIGSESEAKMATSDVSSSLSDISDTLTEIEQDLG